MRFQGGLATTALAEAAQLDVGGSVSTATSGVLDLTEWDAMQFDVRWGGSGAPDPWQVTVHWLDDPADPVSASWRIDRYAFGAIPGGAVWRVATKHPFAVVELEGFIAPTLLDTHLLISRVAAVALGCDVPDEGIIIDSPSVTVPGSGAVEVLQTAAYFGRASLYAETGGNNAGVALQAELLPPQSGNWRTFAKIANADSGFGVQVQNVDVAIPARPLRALMVNASGGNRDMEVTVVAGPQAIT